jgi:hypothetical protein
MAAICRNSRPETATATADAATKMAAAAKASMSAASAAMAATTTAAAAKLGEGARRGQGQRADHGGEDQGVTHGGTLRFERLNTGNGLRPQRERPSQGRFGGGVRRRRRP